MRESDYPTIERSVPLIDIERSGHDRRTVTAYAATFDDLYPITDQFGDYDEEIDPTAFNREIGRGIASVNVFFNHGMTLDGASSERYSMPLGTPIEIKPDDRGLLTVTRYAKTDLADEVLELIDSGAIKYQSFRGAIYEVDERFTPDGRLIRRLTQLGLKEYGPAPFPANDRAEMLAIRSQMVADEIKEMNPDERRGLLALLQNGTLLDTSITEPVDEGQPDAADPPDPSDEEPVGQDMESLILANANRRRR